MTLAVRDQSTESERSDPLAAAERLQSQLSRFLEGWPGIPALAGFIPRADVEETDDAYIVEVELPGVKKNDIDISVAGRRLTVSGELKERERKGVLRRRTRSVGRFHYDVVLPNEIDDDAVTASLDEGVLSVRVPKAARERPRRIEVK